MPMKKYFSCLLFMMSITFVAFGQGYYENGTFIPLSGPQEQDGNS